MRINHEHTDLAEYMGSYVSDDKGRLTFQEGVLVQAVRAGHWLVLDELNLAPSEVLEALNRLLDDNRELLIPGWSPLTALFPSRAHAPPCPLQRLKRWSNRTPTLCCLPPRTLPASTEAARCFPKPSETASEQLFICCYD